MEPQPDDSLDKSRRTPCLRGSVLALAPPLGFPTASLARPAVVPSLLTEGIDDGNRSNTLPSVQVLGIQPVTSRVDRGLHDE